MHFEGEKYGIWQQEPIEHNADHEGAACQVVSA